MKHVEVVAAIIFHDNKILCVQRRESKFEYISRKYEFPGGEIEPGEREVKHEEC
jgi:8-oxo-dGTP diphosphatase